jgi:hypothetical protein
VALGGDKPRGTPGQHLQARGRADDLGEGGAGVGVVEAQLDADPLEEGGGRGGGREDQLCFHPPLPPPPGDFIEAQLDADPLLDASMSITPACTVRCRCDADALRIEYAGRCGAGAGAGALRMQCGCGACAVECAVCGVRYNMRACVGAPGAAPLPSPPPPPPTLAYRLESAPLPFSAHARTHAKARTRTRAYTSCVPCHPLPSHLLQWDCIESQLDADPLLDANMSITSACTPPPAGLRPGPAGCGPNGGGGEREEGGRISCAFTRSGPACRRPCARRSLPSTSSRPAGIWLEAPNEGKWLAAGERSGACDSCALKLSPVNPPLPSPVCGRL